ncbi:protein spaetzle 5 [Drosophila hydei]|uniref:Protein spaetzle 5 n=1 Tax=Drosophila hydei TaxID=7224 RepID=A0A6J1LPR1_DROHY|nr:protein spaetzle 5 [Drosophila hydei]XP_023168065.2 protein spaetzle 5 [Drosophila hydei]
MTKSIKRFSLRLSLRTSSSYGGILLTHVILACISAAFSTPPSCGLYGAPPCQFLPAPPGQTPNCARPGKTYCEHVDNYPTYLIKSLVRKWGYEAASLLVDETWEEFSAVAWSDTPVFYDPKSIFPQRDFANGQDFNGYSYQTPFGSVPQRGVGNSLFAPNPTTKTPTYLLYTSSGPGGGYRAGGQQHGGHSGSGSGSGSRHLYYNNYGKTPYNATLWLKRLVRDLSLKQNAIQAQQSEMQQLKDEAVKMAKDAREEQEVKKQQKQDQEGDQEEEQEQQQEQQKRSMRDVSLNMDLLDIVGVSDNNNNNKKNSRAKRQSPSRSSLCETTSQFITPQAALNSRGNWMFVVNEENTARQMVKAELCASNTCSNLCDLPNGYNSRCEQKFVQKRLIALQGNGQNLYTDTFWFPSCCVCTIAAN